MKHGFHCRLPFTRFFSSSYVLFAFTQPVYTQDLAETAAAANKSSIEMIQQYYSEVEQIQRFKGSESKRESRYWKTRTSARAIERTGPGVVTDVTQKGASLYAVTIVNGEVPGPRAGTNGVLVTAQNRRLLEADPWEVGMFVLPLGLVTKPPKLLYSLDAAIQNGFARQAKWVNENGKRLVHISLECDGGDRTYEVWVDPQTNWMITKCLQIMREDGKVTWRNEYRIDEFREVKPSIFVPIHCSSTFELRGEKIIESVFDINNIRINEELPQQPPSAIPDQGTRAFDEQAGTIYTIDRKGVPVGPQESIGSEYVPVTAEPKEDPLSPSKSRHLFGWLAVILAILTLIVGIIIRFKRRIASRQSAE